MPNSREQLPYSLENERAVLGSILLDNSVFPQAASLEPSDFLIDSHRRIFRKIAAMMDRKEPVDYVSLGEALQQAGDLEAIGGFTTIGQLTDTLPRVSNISHYVQVVKEKSSLRRLAYTSEAISREILDGTDDAGTILDHAETAILKLSEQRGQRGPLLLRTMFEKEFCSLDEFAKSARCDTGVGTGFTKLDALTCGFQPQNLILIAARPSVGKTAFALALLSFAGLHANLPVLLFSLEMSGKEIMSRLVCAEARVNILKFRAGNLTNEENRRIAIAMGRLLDAKIVIDDTSAISVRDLRLRAGRVKQEHGLGLLIIDYIGLIKPPKAENRVQEITKISSGLKALAKGLSVPVIALSQLSRAPENREGHRPQLSDLRDSGALEQDADVVAFLYRQEYHLRLSGQPVPPDLDGTAELIIAKQRNGPTGVVPLVFSSQYASFGGMV